MGSGNTKTEIRKDENTEVKMKKPREQVEDLVNKPPNNSMKNNDLSNINEPVREETKEKEQWKKSLDSEEEKLPPAEDIKHKLSERGFTDAILITHCETTPKYFEHFISLYEAIQIIEEKIKDDDLLGMQRQATVISSSYSKVKQKVALGNFLAEVGFPRSFRNVYLKLNSDFPDLLTYDRELDENLKKSPDVEQSVENEFDKTIKTPESNLNQHVVSVKKSTECSENLKMSSNQTSIINMNTVKPNEHLKGISGTPKPNGQLAEAGEISIEPNEKLNEESGSLATPSEQLGEASRTGMKPSIQAKDSSETSKPSKQQIDDDQPADNQPESDDHKPKASGIHPTKSSLLPSYSCNQTEDSPSTKDINKPLNLEEKKPKPGNPRLKAQDVFNKMVLSTINYTDACDNMNIALSEEGVVQMLVVAVEKLKDCTGQHVKYMNEEGGLSRKTVRGNMLTKVMGTLHNLSKRVPTRPYFHACNAVKIILPLIHDEVNRFAIDALLIIAYIIDEENNNLIMASEGPIKYLISMISKATKKTVHKYLGYTNSELAQGLAQIAVNDNNKKQIVASGAIPVLLHMIEEAKIEKERITAAKALWMLAFDQDNRQVMKNDEKCMDVLNKLKESESDKEKKAASGALWEIEGKDKVTIASPTDGESSSGTTNHVMISYQWDVQKTLIQVKDHLQAAGYRVWMDLEQMGGSTLEAMAKAVENSTVVLICVSQKYKESSNCRSEAEYAFQLKKDIIPLMMESNYRPDGWLGMIMGSKLWIDFSQRHISKIDGSVKDLMRELGVRGKEDHKIVSVTSVDVVDARPTVDISGWTHNDVMDWMKGFGLVLKNKSRGEATSLTGQILTRLHAFRNEVSPEFYYTSLKEDFGFSRMIDVLIFSDELNKLLR